MLQSEVAHRLDASVGTRERGRLTIWREYHTDVINGFNVPPGAFYPPPKVGSRVVRLATRDKFRFDAENKKRFFSMVKKSFAMKRKTLANNLQNWVPHADKKAVQDLLVEMELDFRVRAEDLGIDDFVALYERIEILR